MDTPSSKTIEPPLPPGMKSLDIRPNSGFHSLALAKLEELSSKKVFVIANKSSRKFLEGAADDGHGESFMDALKARGILAAPLNTSVGMGGSEEGLMIACDEAYESGPDVIISVGGGAIQDAGKLIRLWLTSPEKKKCTFPELSALQNQDPMPPLIPQISLPNSFAMAEASHVAGVTTSAKTKSGAASKSFICTHVIFDPALTKGLPDWVRYGTAMRCLEHVVAAVCHPKADEDVRRRALAGLEVLLRGMEKMVKEKDDEEAMEDVYLGGWMAVRALFTGCYPALGHLLENHYSARFDVHQGTCSAILCARILHHIAPDSQQNQQLISNTFGQPDMPASKLVAQLVAKLPGVSKDHDEVGVSMEMLEEFAEWMFEKHGERLNSLSPRKFESSKDIFDMMAFPLEKIVE